MKKLKLFFALFAMLALGVGNAWGAEYELVTSEPSDWSGEYLVVYNKGCFNGSLTTGFDKSAPVNITISNNKINLDEKYAMIIGKQGTAYSLKTASGYYIGRESSSSNGMDAGQTWSTKYTINFTWDATKKTVKIAGKGGKCLGLNSTTWRFYAASNTYVNLSLYKKVESSTEEPALSSIAISGDLENKTYEEGEELDFSGLTVQANYENGDPKDVTNDVEWSYTPNPLTEGTTSVDVTATYEDKTATTTITGLTVNEHIIIPREYCITPNNDFWGTNYTGTDANAATTLSGTQNDISILHTKSGSNLYVNNTQTRVYTNHAMQISVPSGYVITSIAFTADGNNWAGTHTANVGKMTDSKNWAGIANEVTITFGGTCRIKEICVTYEELDETLPTAPTFNPAAGTYNAVQNVTISAEEGTTIHYTLDGTDPTTRSEVYNTPITVSETQTIKAIAVKDEKVSPVASATYTINLPLTTMDQIFAKATAVGGTATSVEITFGNWVVSAVKEDGKTAFVTDGTKGFVIFDKDVNLGFSVGNILSGTATCKVQLYNGFAELTELKSNTAGLSVGSGGTITTQELDAAGIAALTGVNTGSLIKINGTCTSESSKYYVADVQIYTSLYDFGTLEVGAEYNITGIYQPYNTTKEMLPRSAADIEKVVGLPTATISIADITMEIGQEKTIEATITPDAAQSTVQYAITSGNEYITLEGTTITAVAAGTATITATIAEKADEYKGATKEFTVTVKPQNIAVLPFTFNGGKADIENTLGMSQTGLDDDYNSAPKLKFNGAGDNVIIHFDSQAGEFSFVLKQNGQNAGTFTVFESANGEDYTSVWAGGDFGNAQSETIKPTLSATARYVKFEYTTKGTSTNYALGSISIAKPDLRQEASLVWNPTSVTLTQGEAFTAPTLNNPYSVSGITYESSNDEVATVTTAGVIALGSATGTATITATFAGEVAYKPATATCTIQVKPVQEDCEGSDDFATDESENPSSYLERTTAAGWKATNAARVTIEDETYFAINGKTSTVGTITSPVLNGGLGSIKIRYANTYKEANGVSFQLDIKQNDEVVKTYTITKANAAVEKGTVYTELIENINVAGDFQMVFTNLSPSKSTENKDRVSIGHLCWTGYEEVVTPDTYTRDVTPGNFGTICLPYAGTITGATLFVLSYKDANYVYVDEVVGTTLVAGTPYLFLPTSTKITVNYTDYTYENAGQNGALHGTYVEMDNAALMGKYIISGNKYYLINNATGNSKLPANRAYFVLDEVSLSKPVLAPGARRIALGTNGQNTATGMENVDASAQPVKTIINGQLFILRGEKMYDAQGKLVK